jgi:integrase
MTPTPFKRSTKPGSNYYVRFEVDGRAYLWSTKTDDVGLARKRGKAYRDAIVAKAYGLIDGMKQGGDAPTIGGLIEAYMALPAPPEATRTANKHSLLAVLAISGLSERDRVARIDRSVITAYQTHCLKERPGCMAAVTTCNAHIRKARSVFSKRSLNYYHGTANQVPAEVSQAFFSVPLLREAHGDIELPTDAAVAKAMTDLTGDAKRAFILARYAGLRSGEIREARRSWLDGNILTVAPDASQYVAKGKRCRKIALPPEAVEILLQSDDLVYLVGPRRHELVVRELPATLIAMGFPKKKPLHSLRRLFGSVVYTTQGGWQAKEALGHASLSTTEKSYAKGLNVPDAVSWAG